MKKSLSKAEVEKQINEFFENVNNKNSKEIKKIKNLAMAYKIKLGEKRKLFCKKCLSPYIETKIRINNNFKTTKCEDCGNISRWKIK